MRDPRRAEALAAQHERDDQAPRLRDAVARLSSLRLRFEDARPNGQQEALPYVKPVMVATAPARLEVCCMDKACDGRHDLTDQVLPALAEAQTRGRGESKCHGYVGELPCDHTLRYTFEATYSG